MSSDKGPGDPLPPRKGGRARMRELAAEAAAERAPLEAALIAGLGREPTALDLVAIETLAATVIRARRLRATGRNDADERKTLVQIIRATGLRPSPPAAPTEQQSDPFGLFIDDPAPAVAEEREAEL
jgi:hypothetical protein